MQIAGSLAKYGWQPVFVLAFLCSACSADNTVSLAFASNGLTSLMYGGTNFLNYGDLRANSATFQDQSGNTSSGTMTSTLVVDAGAQTLTRQFSWGTVQGVYTVAGNQLKIAITVQNTSQLTLTALELEPLGLTFPSAPAEYNGSTPLLATNMGDPTAIRMTYKNGVLVFCNDDVLMPLLTGFPWSFDKPASTKFPLRTNTGRDSMYPDSLPTITRPVPPGDSDAYHLSLRFGASGASTTTLASDVYQAFAKQFPFEVNWPNRGVIGQLVMGTSNAGWPKNPRGWFLDSSIDVTTTSGIQAFEQRVLSWADGAVSQLQYLHAQGMIAWDIEGEQFPQPVTYIGDPRLQGKLAPEMNGVVDQFFAKFRDAGFAVGVCIRPQQLTKTGTGTPSQTTLTDPTQLMIQKIQFAKQRWGATLFYVDSNGDPGYPIDAGVFSRIYAAVPGILLIPEHENTEYFGVSAPYNELKQGVTSTPALARSIYPGSFSVIDVSDGPVQDNFDALVNAVRGGDILLTRGWWADPANSTVVAIYQEAQGSAKRATPSRPK